MNTDMLRENIRKYRTPGINHLVWILCYESEADAMARLLCGRKCKDCNNRTGSPVNIWKMENSNGWWLYQLFQVQHLRIKNGPFGADAVVTERNRKWWVMSARNIINYDMAYPKKVVDDNEYSGYCSWRNCRCEQLAAAFTLHAIAADYRKMGNLSTSEGTN